MRLLFTTTKTQVNGIASLTVETDYARLLLKTMALDAIYHRPEEFHVIRAPSGDEMRKRLQPPATVTGADLRLFREATNSNTDDMYYVLGNHGTNLPITGKKSTLPLQPSVAILVRYLINFPEGARLPAMPGFRYPAFDDVFLAAAKYFPDALEHLTQGATTSLSAPILGMICGLRRLAGPEWQRNENKRRAPASKRLLLHILAACEDYGATGLYNYLACVDAEAHYRSLDGITGVLKRGHWDRQRFQRMHRVKVLGEESAN